MPFTLYFYYYENTYNFGGIGRVIKAELDRLWRVERSETMRNVEWAAGLDDRSENTITATIKKDCGNRPAATLPGQVY
ncbi:MAG: hypothetical protein ACFB2Y_03170 [Fulvivirga sp.]